MSKQVFLDLGFPEDEAREQSIRAEIAAHISILIEQQGLRQREAAKLFKVPQPTISKIVSGNLSNLSLAYLLRMLLRADVPFAISRGKSAEEVEVSIGEDVDSRATRYDVVTFDHPDVLVGASARVASTHYQNDPIEQSVDG